MTVQLWNKPKAKIKTETKSKTKTETKSKTKIKPKKRKAQPSNRPTSDECRLATTALSSLHPHVVQQNDERRKTWLESCGRRSSITDSIVSTMLSQNTTEANSTAAFSSLKQMFPEWEQVADCDDISTIEASIRVAGLAKTRAQRIRELVRTVREEQGTISMEYLRDMTDGEIKQELSRFKGLGPKTISCVLLFTLGRDEFPVDTHVLRISQKLNWVPSSATRESAYTHLNEMVPSDVKLDLHCLLVTHGKHCHSCAANGRPQFPPKDGSKLKCPLANLLSSSSVIDKRGEFESVVEKKRIKMETNRNYADINRTTSKAVKQEAYMICSSTLKLEADVIGSIAVKQEVIR